MGEEGSAEFVIGLRVSLVSWTKFMRQTNAHVECLFIIDLYGGDPKS